MVLALSANLVSLAASDSDLYATKYYSQMRRVPARSPATMQRKGASRRAMHVIESLWDFANVLPEFVCSCTHKGERLERRSPKLPLYA